MCRRTLPSAKSIHFAWRRGPARSWVSPNPLARVFPGAAQTPAHGVLCTLPTGPAPLFPARYRDFLPGSRSLARRMRN